MRRAAIVVVTLLAVAFAAFVWPTMYRYEHGAFFSTEGSSLIRINRFTGKVQAATEGGWLP
jgi:hypothetical protein